VDKPRVQLSSLKTRVSTSPLLIRWKWPEGYVRDPDKPHPKPWQQPVLWFSKEFLWKDSKQQYRAFRDWTIDLDAVDNTSLSVSEDEDHKDPRIWAGVRIRHANPDALYILTGEQDDEGLLKGVWPD
jgi:hypothetical protein